MFDEMRADVRRRRAAFAQNCGLGHGSPPRPLTTLSATNWAIGCGMTPPACGLAKPNRSTNS